MSKNESVVNSTPNTNSNNPQTPPRAEITPKLETTVETSKKARVRFMDFKTVKTPN
ncbi:hypothetical protein [Acinetobacter calcoaceticus]|uniref:hypothetical protein n=1 Tax=Acinetobacter calcoaceticus TaxID=471 RepID=UPI0012BAC900|nr:hypothetical protein [Acinetobacter calcoaceticus]